MNTSSENTSIQVNPENIAAPQETVVTLDGVNYSLDQLDDDARKMLASIRFCDEAIRQRENELAVADTARLAYGAALKRELAKASSATE